MARGKIRDAELEEQRRRLNVLQGLPADGSEVAKWEENKARLDALKAKGSPRRKAPMKSREIQRAEADARYSQRRAELEKRHRVMKAKFAEQEQRRQATLEELRRVEQDAKILAENRRLLENANRLEEATTEGKTSSMLPSPIVLAGLVILGSAVGVSSYYIVKWAKR